MPAVLLPGVDFDLGALDSHLGLAERAGWKRCGKLPDELIVSQYNGSQILERQCAKVGSWQGSGQVVPPNSQVLQCRK